MDEVRYLISDASKKVDVETHVLRYWEEELGISGSSVYVTYHPVTDWGWNGSNF